MLAGGLLLLGLVVVLTQMPGGSAASAPADSQELVDTKGDIDVATASSYGPSCARFTSLRLTFCVSKCFSCFVLWDVLGCCLQNSA